MIFYVICRQKASYKKSKKDSEQDKLSHTDGNPINLLAFKKSIKPSSETRHIITLHYYSVY